MAESILSTKLYLPPPQPRAVHRPRLIARLDEGLQRNRKLTLLSAPAGFGKTTLVSEWVTAGEHPAAWLSLDEGEGDPTRFLTYLVAALRTVAPDVGETVTRALQSSQPPPIPSMLTALLNEIAALPDSVVLVLDDYHVIDSKPVDDALAFLIEHLPPQLYLVIMTREDPRLPLSRLRALGQLTELRAADLRFTPAEAAEFLNEAMGLNLSAGDVSALETRTEGWIAGLQLAALSMQGREDVSGFIRAFTGDNRYIVDYLVEEVLQRQPEHVREFLLRTSILHRLSGPLCNAVTGRDDSRALLEHLERGNLFVVPLDDNRHWFRYHHLFAEVLRARATTEQASQMPVWHLRASEWHEQHGVPSEAIRYAVAGEDFARAAHLVELASHAMLATRQDETFLGWLRSLPDEQVRRRPVLSVYYALALLSYDLDAAEARLIDAERGLDALERAEPPPDEIVVSDKAGLRSLPGIIAIVRAYRAGALGDVTGIVTYARQASDLLPESDHLWRGGAAALLAIAYWTTGELEAAYQAMSEARALLATTDDVSQLISGSIIQADIRAAQGRLRDAAEIFDHDLGLIAEQGEPMSPPIADLFVAIAELHRERNDLEAAVQQLQRSKEIGEHSGISEYRHRWYILMARIEEARGNQDSAQPLLDEAERLYVPSPDPILQPIVAWKARLWIRQDRLAEASAWAEQSRLTVGDDLSYLREFEHVTLARLLIARYRRDRDGDAIRDAVALLARLQRAAEKGGRNGSLIEILILQALAHEARGDVQGALAPLERALTLAEPEGYARVYIDEGAPMYRLLSALSDRGRMPDYTARLLAGFDEVDPPALARIAAVPPVASHSQPLVEPLSQRELEVLRLVAQGLSNREISERLFVAVSTIKGHNRIIFDKLQVRRRTEAVARARELGLL
jgi:LuxR family transcriptional regulator, maltose regulon positive regulatory protein